MTSAPRWWLSCLPFDTTGPGVYHPPMSEQRLRTLVICHDVVGHRMAGTGIRAWETARLLARQQPTSLIAPQSIDRAGDGFTTGNYTWGDPSSLAPWLAAAEVVVANAHVLAAHPELASFPRPLALDLYDPVLVEALELHRDAHSAVRQQSFTAQQQLLLRQLGVADFLVCATERQRDLYLGALLTSGRVQPADTDDDPQLRRLIDVAPFGLDPQPPVRQHSLLRGALPGVPADAEILLWTGGLWDWLDPLTAIDAMPEICAARPRARLVFLAGKHPGPAPAMTMPGRARAHAAAPGVLASSVLFYDEWIPYARRADALLDADLAITLHRSTLETTYAAVRSRFLDHLWAALPSIVTDGDAAADLVRQHDLGRVVPPAEPAALAQAVIALFEDNAARIACASNTRDLAAHFAWQQTLAPLAAFCRRPWMRERSTSLTPPVPEYHTPVNTLDNLWHVSPQPLGAAKDAANSLTRWYIAPIIDQQNAFNAGVVHALQAVTGALDDLRRAQHEIADLRSRITALEDRASDLDHAQTQLALYSNSQPGEPV